MIPKTIHFCWMSDDAYPEKILKCIDSWKRVLPDYEIVKWDYSRFPRGKCKWVDQAFDAKKYAFCADYIRAYALYNYGGIYLDSDVEVVKSYDDLLSLPYFYGREMVNSPIEAATVGAEKGNALIKRVLDSYEGRDFVNPDGSINNEAMPWIFKRIIEEDGYVVKDIKGVDEFDHDENVINVFPMSWFSPKDWVTGKIGAEKDTYSVHHFAASWLTPKARLCMVIAQHTHPLIGHYVDYLLRPPHVVAKNLVISIRNKLGSDR